MVTPGFVETLGIRMVRGRGPSAADTADANPVVTFVFALQLTFPYHRVKDKIVEALSKWFDVRARYLQWTDGRLAQMVIATDITPSRPA